MNKTNKYILQIPENIKEDTLNYRGQVDKFVKGETSPIAFRAYRVPMGVYEQRTVGKFMVRIRIGAGLVLPFQLKRIAELSTRFGDGVVHVTTRQDIQLHYINIEDTPDVLESLLEVSLSPRGGGGNTVRNVTACPRSGVCPKEKFPVAPYAIETAEYLLQHKSSYNLPRKYKIVFSGCSEDCAFASTADLGFFAHIKDELQGFAAYAGGGLGLSPRTGIRIEEFVTTDEVLFVAEAIKQLFDAYGDRSNKHRARLRYVLNKVGEQEFIRLYNHHKQQVIADGLPGNIPEPGKIEFIRNQSETSVASDKDKSGRNLCTNWIQSEKYSGYYTLRIRLKLGDISAEKLVQVANVADESGQELVRTTQLQDLLITSIPGEKLQSAVEILEKLGFDFKSNGPEIINCTGAATCKLGLCLSRGLSEAIAQTVKDSRISDDCKEQVIRISGCPNSCANHYIADLGFEGRAKRVKGKLMPYYDVLAGTKIYEGKTQLAQKVGSLPAKKIPGFVREYFSNSYSTGELTELISKHTQLPDNIPGDLYCDFSADEPFSLAGRGPGECGAGVMDVIKLDVDEAKDTIKATPVSSQNIYKAIVSAARALLILFGLEPKKDKQIFDGFTKHLIEPGWVKSDTQKLLDSALDWKLQDVDSIDELLPHVKDLIGRVEELFLSLDANLKFKIEPVAHKAGAESKKTKDHIIDLRGVPCPLNFIKAKLELEKVKVGDVLEVLLDEGEPVQNAPASFAEQGQEVMEIKKIDDHCCVKVRRIK